MVRPRVFVTRVIAQEGLDKIAEEAEAEVWPEEPPPPYEVLVEKAKDAEGLVTLVTDKIDAALMDAAPKLKVVANMAVGFDNIDIIEAAKRHISVSNTPRVLTETTADFAFTLLMAGARRIVEADKYTKSGQWKTWGPKLLLGQDIYDSTLAIIGLGRIGVELAKRAHGFNMRVLYNDAFRRSNATEKGLGLEFVPTLAEILPMADFVTMHVPLLPQTRHLISTAEFALMKPTAVFINCSRGPVVDQKALYQALKSKQIFAAAIDVTEPEPISIDDPLLTLDNVIIAPHIASSSFTTRINMALMAADNLIAGLHSKPLPNSVIPEVLLT
ncbi:2-hydroxyacid dehydrogenase [Chloroflexota bacterium]